MTIGNILSPAAVIFAWASATFTFPALAHNHQHNHSEIHQGKFDDADVRDRKLTDWQGRWISLYPLLQNGSLQEVFEHKAATGKDKTAEEYKAYYTTGYASEVTAIAITPDSISFTRPGKTSKGLYRYSGFKILHYPSGKKGVRYLFTRRGGDTQAPEFVQFSDHDIEPTKAKHFHIFFGNDSHLQLEKELNHWPTFYPTAMRHEQIVADLMLE
ncbi:hypothetical protein BL250_15250 [Erwinia sp. OLTSP20]|uniref:ZinT/AdcA family metal-binding protein n=1 Tax=unclassified Erwinia TaxID=2622719 RepID=UPI000C1A4389|nr:MULTISPECIES: ZinT/AdcA family metal-binding protein [unclassified Erwinia]PIJ48422.1 hypothetical protein BV501_17200 [Erwinia sp. OAMSP11]PIJ68429.1 hypothetical protein BK416_16550 [Erwinia sp. OLSSP12]PIJ79087.1 hypothetical protein BLD47_15645 [Erwinia sp. OLCASP19]PIJ79555.1 hypothetical protein BLD46_16765 [Erwinia sp. OLMTSP26]PIJ81858.1 hypothetical protein BLD49_16000 [Erwinia sp. OLMDSP33]